MQIQIPVVPLTSADGSCLKKYQVLPNITFQFRSFQSLGNESFLKQYQVLPKVVIPIPVVWKNIKFYLKWQFHSFHSPQRMEVAFESVKFNLKLQFQPFHTILKK